MLYIDIYNYFILPIAIPKVQRQAEGEQVARSNEAKKNATVHTRNRTYKI
jgi:hypothetical protein